MEQGLVAGALSEWGFGETRRAAHLRNAAAALESVSTPSGDFLRSVLQSRSERLIGWVLIAMTTPENAERLQLVDRALRSDDSELRAQAIEALDSLADDVVSEPLLDLLESGSVTESVPEEMLDLLADDFDPWIAALARRARVELQTAMSDTTGRDLSDSTTMNVRSETLERMIALRRVPMFSDLDPEDLELVAAATTEEHFLAGETVYRKGDAADDMLFLVSGTADVTVGHDSDVRRIASYGPGAHVGELALLQRSERSADVTAGERRNDRAQADRHRPTRRFGGETERRHCDADNPGASAGRAG